MIQASPGSNVVTMKTILYTLVLSIWAVAAHGANLRQPLDFDTYSGYFVSNKFEPDSPASFAVINDREQFDRVFGVAFVMGDKFHRLPADAFPSRQA